MPLLFSFYQFTYVRTGRHEDLLLVRTYVMAMPNTFLCTRDTPNARKRLKMSENVQKRTKMPETSEASETSESVRKFSSEGHAAPILRRVRAAARPLRRPRRGRGGRRRRRGRFVHLFSRTFIGKHR